MASPPNRSGRTGFGANGSANDKGAGSIDREAKCPLLLRVFCASSRHNSLSDYNKGENIVYCGFFRKIDTRKPVRSVCDEKRLLPR